jgi:Glucodextranase, domain B
MIRGSAGRIAILVAAFGCSRGPPSSSSPRTATAIAPGVPQVNATAVVISRKGKVELQRAGGVWSDAQVGDRLAPSDSLRTGGTGEAEVGVDGVRMRVLEASSLRLKEATARSLRAQVRGAVESDVDPGKGALDVEVDGSDARARSTGGHFYVTADGRGVVAVAAVSGSVNLVGKKKQVEVHEGEVSHVTKDEPDAPSPALRRVLLSVRWPEERATSKDTVPVSGKVEAGSRVFIQGQPIPVEPGGSFRAEVPLRDGTQKVAVLAIDPMGRRKQVDTTIVRDQTVPQVKVKKRLWQWH